MNGDYDDSSSSALTALAAAASIARSDTSMTSSAGTPKQDGDGDNSSISSNTTKYDFTSSNDDASANGPVITKAKSGNISNDESAKTIRSLLRKADAASNHGSQKRKSQNYSSSSSSDFDEDDDESKEFLISRIPKPKRPMTAYNFFFQAERKKIIREEEEASKNAKNSSSSSGTRRQGKASNHQASFENMGKTIGRRWKEVNKEDLERYQALGAKESRRYKREMKVYNAKIASIRAKKSLRAEAKKMRREHHPGTRKAPSSANSITDTNTTATLSTIGTARDTQREGDALSDFINSLSQDQLKQLLRLRDSNRKQLEQKLLQSSSLQQYPQQQSIPAQSINQLQSTASPALLSSTSPACLHVPPASYSQQLPLSSTEISLIQSQGQMIAQLQAQVQALQRQQISQASLSPPLLYPQQHQQIGQMWSNNANSTTSNTGMRLPTNAPLRYPTGKATSRFAAALSSSYSGTLAGQQQKQQQQQANPLIGNAAMGNNATSPFFGL